ncbi:MAG: hypothetical protein LBC61_05390 [Candidatus Peribacteria bacterium]|nr:hypothetical protein [Candidatus Peribacteria bacterium]
MISLSLSSSICASCVYEFIFQYVFIRENDVINHKNIITTKLTNPRINQYLFHFQVKAYIMLATRKIQKEIVQTKNHHFA